METRSQYKPREQGEFMKQKVWAEEEIGPGTVYWPCYSLKRH